MLNVRDSAGKEWLVTGKLHADAINLGDRSIRPLRDLEPLEVTKVRIVKDAPMDRL